jgi:hypothetical protein
MSENKQFNDEINEKIDNYEDAVYQENQPMAGSAAAGPGANYSGGPARDFTSANRINMEAPRNYGAGQNPQYNTPNRPAYGNPNYQANYNQPQMNNYRGDGRMNNQGNYRGNDGMNYAGNYRPEGRANYPGNYPGDDGMNYQANNRAYGRPNYPANYRVEDDYCYDGPQPYYPHDYDCDCDYYEGRRPYYRGYRPYRRTRGWAGYPNMPGYDPYYNQGMMPGSWWHPFMIRDFINRPRVNDFLRGVGIATIGLVLAPSITRTLRPIVVKAVQGAMAASDEVKNIFADAKEDMEDIFAEANWEGSRSEGFHRGEDERQNK